MLKLFSVGGLVGNLSLEQQVIVAKKARFDGIDYIASTKDIFFQPKEILSLTKKYNISLSAVHIPLLLVLHTPQFTTNYLQKLLTYFPECQRFNFHLSGFVNPLGKHIQALEIFRDTMRERKIIISCESNPNEYYIFKYYPKETYDPELFAQFCIKYHLPMNLDTSHIAAWDYDIVTFFKKYHKHINLLHISDMTPHKQHLPLGKGALPLKEFFKTLRTLSYKGIAIFEVSNFPKAISQEDIINELKHNIEMFT